LLKQGTDPAIFKRIFDEIVHNYLDPELKRMLGQSLQDLAKQGSYLRYYAMPMKDIHLHSNMSAELSVNSNIQYVYIFSAVAFFILLIACINFMNLATAQSAGRAKEVGIRKVLGGERGTLITRFLTESALTVIMSLVLALCVITVALPAFNVLAGKELQIANLLSWKFITVTAAIPLIVGLMAGSYPAFFLSGFQPIAVLKGKIRSKMSGGGLRSILVVVQFTMSIVLLTGTVVVYRQLNYIQHKKLGFEREQVMIVKNTGVLTQQQAHTLKQELQRLPGVTSVSLAAYLPVPSNRNDNPFYNKPGKQQEDAVMMQNWRVDHDYIKTLGIEMAEGRFFSTAFPSDSDGVVINEAAAKKLGYSKPLGQQIYYFGDGEVSTSSPIIGIVKDFHFESLRTSIAPVAMFLTKSKHSTASNLCIRTTSGTDVMNLAGKVESTWKTFVPEQPFAYNFLNQEFNNMYKAEEKVGRIAFLFAALAIVIACLGLFGLVAFTVEQRTKGIGIRKVLGASVSSIVSLLSKDLLRLVLIAIVLATPVAWYLMQQWLQDYEYRIHMQWWMFIVAGGMAVIVALVTISFQSIKAALLNPIKSLKSE
jgi:putative ABC transport system permease protein